MPSMPIYFWGDEDGSRYRESYFDLYPRVWRHGDWIEITERGTAIIYGRSDSTINRGGIRMGTSEIYRAVLALDQVLDDRVQHLIQRQHGAVDLTRPHPNPAPVDGRVRAAVDDRGAALGDLDPVAVAPDPGV